MQNYTMKRKRREGREKSGSAGDQAKEHEELGKLRSQGRVAEVSCWLLWPGRKKRVGGREMDAREGTENVEHTVCGETSEICGNDTGARGEEDLKRQKINFVNGTSLSFILKCERKTYIL